jgi:hypothetical protein
MRKTLALAVLVISPAAWAATAYEYAGNNYATVYTSSSPADKFDTSMAVSGAFVIDDAIIDSYRLDISDELLSFSFSDGVTTYTEGTSEVSAFIVSTDVSGDITDWWIVLKSGIDGDWQLGEEYHVLTTQTFTYLLNSPVKDAGETYTCIDYQGGFAGMGGECTNNDLDAGSNRNVPGTWAQSSVVPIPAAVWLFGSGLGLLGWFRRRAA